jgi:hypothetical protein
MSPGDLFLERALTLDPRVTLERAATLPVDQKPGSAGPGRYDLVVFDGLPEEPVKARGVLTFGQAGGPSPVEAHGQMKGPSFVSAQSKPLMDGVDLNGVFIDSGEKVTAKASGEVLATSTEGPLIVASSGEQKHIYVAFEPLHSDFPLQVGFPIFVANALDYLGGEGNASMLAVRAGNPFALSAKAPVTLSSPDEGSEKIAVTGGQAIVRDIRTVGRYQVEVDGQKRNVFATLRSDRESAIEPIDDVQLGGGKVTAIQAPVHFADFWRPLALLALVVLGCEWWLYARRS